MGFKLHSRRGADHGAAIVGFGRVDALAALHALGRPEPMLEATIDGCRMSVAS
jgi:hypothetical protein